MALKKIKAEDIFHYPDPEGRTLRKTIAQKFKIPINSVMLANGSEALIDLVAQIIVGPDDEVIIPEATFPLFEKGVRLVGGQVVFSKMDKNLGIDLNDIKDRINKKTKAIFLCNPNNPTGKVIPKKKILKLVKSVESVFVIVDEANIEFGGRTVIREVKNFENLIVFRTFSKAFGLAGLRVGFIVANPRLIKILKKVRQPFPVSGLSQKAALAALSDKGFIRKSRRFMNREREFLIKELQKRGFEIIKSQANNILVKFDKLFNSSDEFLKLLAKKDISVVDGRSFRGLGKAFIRISPRKRKTNKKFLKCVDEIQNRLS